MNNKELLANTELSHYRIVSKIGAGGMGEVFLAEDTRLDRKVAIKVLPADFSKDEDRLRRFEQEAKATSALNHPNILTIYDIGEHEGAPFIVAELLDGEELRQRLDEGPIPLRKVTEYAQQIVSGLTAAHAKGIVHRDLKPENLFITNDERVKILDFGLAKLREPLSIHGSENTTRKPMTERGMIMGTVVYMSPEQVRGDIVDHRSDIFSFGLVLSEMITGHRAFERETIAETMVAILKEDAGESIASEANISPMLARIVNRCLEKKPEGRFQSASDLGFALEALTPMSLDANRSEAAYSAGNLTASGRGRQRRAAWLIAVAVTALAIVALMIAATRYLRPTQALMARETRTDIVTPATDQPTMFALSPDGREIVFVASGDGPSRLWLRSLATTTVQPLAGTEGAKYPFWSPDGRSIGFFASGALKRLDLGGGAPQTLAAAANGNGGTWNSDGTIVFVPNFNQPLTRVSATGGEATAVTASGPGSGIMAPYFLPDGRRFVFYSAARPDETGIYLGSLDGSEPKWLTPAESSGVYLASGWLLWVRAGALVAQRLDEAKVALTGEVVKLADSVAVTLGESAVSVAATGLIAYRTGEGGQTQLTWVDRSGTPSGTVGSPDGNVTEPRVSPDGRRIVMVRMVQSNLDLWLQDGPRMIRLTFDPASEYRPVWSPDSTRIAFVCGKSICQIPASGGGAVEQIVVSDQLEISTSWSADGRFLLYESIVPPMNADLWVVPMVGNHTPSVFLNTNFREAKAAFSPDGKWVAYHSNESARNEIYVRPFAPPSEPGAPIQNDGRQWQVSTAGGIHPVWRPDGKELYYVDLTGAIVAAPITVSGGNLTPGTPVVLFQSHIFGGGVDANHGRQYDVAPDGRFLINTVLDTAPAPITLLMDWNPEVKK